MHISGSQNNQGRVKEVWPIGSITVLLSLFPSMAYAHDPIGMFLFLGGATLIGPLLVGGILLWWKRKELVVNRGIVTVIYITGLIIVEIVEFFSINRIVELIEQTFPNVQPENWPMWSEEIYLFIFFLVIPIGAGVLLARALYHKFREPLSPTEAHSGEENA